mmetsp:Transcript_30709/g.42942  ORF Transcript_30709/g.42942 Transcript_30709/m.42942 type:complete len:82 (+) Transcript_30709:367-612(+)
MINQRSSTVNSVMGTPVEMPLDVSNSDECSFDCSQCIKNKSNTQTRSSSCLAELASRHTHSTARRLVSAFIDDHSFQMQKW